MRMVGQERPPGLARRTPRSTPTVASNRAVADRDAQLEQLPSDPLGTSQPVLAGHRHGQLPYLGAPVSRQHLAADACGRPAVARPQTPGALSILSLVALCRSGPCTACALQRPARGPNATCP